MSNNSRGVMKIRPTASRRRERSPRRSSETGGVGYETIASDEGRRAARSARRANSIVLARAAAGALNLQRRGAAVALRAGARRALAGGARPPRRGVLSAAFAAGASAVAIHASPPPAIARRRRPSASTACLRRSRLERRSTGARAVVAALALRSVEPPSGRDARPPMQPAMWRDERSDGSLHAAVPVRPGPPYHVVFAARRAAGRAAWSTLPRADRRSAGHDPTTVVGAGLSDGDVVPENQLRLYIHFSAPMGMKRAASTTSRCSTTRARRRRSVPAARRGVLERRSHALHGLLRSGPPEARHPAESADGPFARRAGEPTRSSSTRVARRARAAAEGGIPARVHGRAAR